MAKNKTEWKYYVYQFFSGDKCVYVGKGCAKRFNIQAKRFSEFKGHIVAYFKTEQLALSHERLLINELAPSHNISMNPINPEPWKYSLVPSNDKDFYMWCDKLGTKQMAGRIILAKPWSIIRSYGIDIDSILSKVESFCGEYHGARC